MDDVVDGGDVQTTRSDISSEENRMRIRFETTKESIAGLVNLKMDRIG